MIRPATPDDEPALRALDHASWAWENTPVALRDRRFDTDGVLVEELDGQIAGYVKLGELWPIPSVEHVREVKGLAVSPAHRRRGVGRTLVAAAMAHARADGARKLTLRVLGHNQAGRRFYAACGFEVEGVLRDLFLLEGRYVDDVLMSVDLTAGGSSAST